MRGVFLHEIAQLLGLAFSGEGQISGYRVDSRAVQPGDLFFALKGEKVDGHRFLSDVAERGAVAAVVSEAVEDCRLTLFLVDDVLAALQQLARELFVTHRIPLLGITGSVGKTTVKEFAATLLSGKFHVAKSPLSHNSKITYPLSLLNRTPEDQVMVSELGMSFPGEIATLVNIAPPEVAMITKVALAHAQNFPEGISGIARAKAEIFSHPSTKVAILDSELMAYPEIREALPKKRVLVSLDDASADLYLAFSNNRFFVDECGVRVAQFDLPFREKHFIQDALLAMAAARQFGMQWEEIEQQLPKLSLPGMRFERVERGGVSIINDAYNANPASVRAALESFPAPKPGGKKIAVLGTMKELGSFSEKAHEEIGHFAQTRVDQLLCLGEEASPLFEAFKEGKKPAEHFKDHASLAKRLQELISPGDVVLLKGSRSMEIEKILEMAFPDAAATL